MTRCQARAALLLAGILTSALLVGCAGVEAGSPIGTAPQAPTPTVPSTAPGESGVRSLTESSENPHSEPGTRSPGSAGTRAPRHSGTSSPSESPSAARDASTERQPHAREPRRSSISIPAIRLRSAPVVRYTGSPDDAEGTRIQNRGPTASPRGPGGGVGPGELGNFIVTGHRTSHAAPFRDLPDLRKGDRVRIRSEETAYVYRVTGTRWTSFRSQRSLAQQSAAVPGHPYAEAVRPMITLSTCATPEDHAAGNYWSDRFGNPEHRIDKIGVLVATIRTGS